MDYSKLFKSERKEVARYMRRLYRQNLTTTSGGNISLQLPDGIIVITPSATDKGRMQWREVGLMKPGGKNLTPGLKPSIEAGMHLSIYSARDIGAIIHAHPVFATAFTAMKKNIDTSLTAEAYVILGEPMFVPYEHMGTKELADIVSKYIKKSDLLLLENHGILSVGSNLLQAFDKIEVLENAARMTFITELMGIKTTLSEQQRAELKKLFK
jgi:L-fuculose-phosphate aldolase